MTSAVPDSRSSSRGWLRLYYAIRFAVAVGWVALALTLGPRAEAAAAVLLAAYPAWDAAANLLDAARSGGLRRNLPQGANAAISVAAAVAVAVALGRDEAAVLPAFGLWALFAGLAQLVTGLRRWKRHGAQWLMVLSSAQSTLAGVFFASERDVTVGAALRTVAPYAAFGGIYFLVAAVWLAATGRRRSAEMA